MTNEMTVESAKSFMEIIWAGKVARDRQMGHAGASLSNRTLNLSESLFMKTVPFPLNKVYVKQSKIHGDGVFAQTRIHKGEIITMYPCHVLIISPNEDYGTPGNVAMHVNSDLVCRMYGETWRMSESFQDWHFYCLDVTKRYRIVGLPELRNDPAHMGHLINDAAKPSNDPRSHQIYIDVSTSKMNCVFYPLVPSMTAVVAHKDIEPNEEVLACYGLPYWKSRMQYN